MATCLQYMGKHLILVERNMNLKSQGDEKSDVVAENDGPVGQLVCCLSVPLSWLARFTVGAGLNLICHEYSVLPNRYEEPQ